MRHLAIAFLTALFDVLAVFLAFAAMLLLGGCTDTFEPDNTGRIWTCTGAIHCAGRDYPVSPGQGCAVDKEDAAAQWEAHLQELAKGAQCGGEEWPVYHCDETWKPCTLK